MQLPESGGRTWRRLQRAKICAALLITLALSACKEKAPTQVSGKEPPKVRATVIAIRTTTQPANKTFNHTIVVAGNQARSTDELDRWRLFDLEKETVTYVDDAEKTRRSEPIATALARHRQALSLPLRDQVPRAQFETTGESKPLLGVNAGKSVISAGGYRRELWIGVHPQIPPRIFAFQQITDQSSSQLAPMMKSVYETLFNVRGYPLADHAELALGSGRMVVDRNVIGVSARDVPESLLKIPADYRDLTPPAATTERGARRRPASLLLPDRKAPAGE